MAPMAPLGRRAAIDLVRRGQLPVWFGSPHPHVMILEQDAKFRIRALVVDPVKSATAGKAAIARGQGWMPEQHYALGQPTGQIFAEASSADELIVKMRDMTWPDDW